MSYSYGKRHLGRVIPTHDRVITVGNPPPHPTIFVGPMTVRELKKRMEVDAKKLEKKLEQRKCLAEKNQDETKNISTNLLACTSEDKENVPSGEETTLVEPLTSNSLLPPESYSFSSKDNSNSSNQTYTLDNSDDKSPSHVLNSTYDKMDETEDYDLQIDVTQNVTSIRERKSVANKSTFRNYRQNRPDSMASDIYFNVNKTNDNSQLTDTSANINLTNRSVLLSFDNLKLDDECGNLTNMSMKAYKDSPVAKILMDDKFSRDCRSPLKNKSKTFTPGRKPVSSNVEKPHQNSPSTPRSTLIRKSVSKTEEIKPTTPKSTPARKSISKSKEDITGTPKTTPNRRSRKSLFMNKEEDIPVAPKSSPARKSISKISEEIQSTLKNSKVTLRTNSSAKRKFSHLNEEESLNVSGNRSPVIRTSLVLNKENISVRKTPGKMSATLITELKAENCLINSSFRDSTGSSNNRSTPDVFHRIPNEMWKSTLDNVPEKPSNTSFKSKLPQLKKTPNKYAHVQSPIGKYIHRGEGIKSMSKLRHSSCVNELTVTSKSETKKELSESKNKPCRIPQRCVNVQRKLDLPKVKKSDSSNSSIVSGTSTIHH